MRPEDSANLLETVKDLRQALGKDAIISAATPLNVWAGPDGNPMTDISAFVPYLDHVTVMNYDESLLSSPLSEAEIMLTLVTSGLGRDK